MTKYFVIFLWILVIGMAGELDRTNRHVKQLEYKIHKLERSMR